MEEAKLVARECVKYAPGFEVKTGKWLFSYLPGGATTVVMLSPINPYYRNMTEKQIAEWCRNHLEFDGKRIVRVFVGDLTIWRDNLLWKELTRI